MLFTLLVVMHILVSILLVVVILMQSSKGGGLAGTFGGSGSTAFLGGRQAADTLTKATVFLAVLFALLSIVLNIVPHDAGADEGIIEKQVKEGGTSPAVPQ